MVNPRDIAGNAEEEATHTTDTTEGTAGGGEQDDAPLTTGSTRDG